jgi:UDP-N-acetylglucosamine--N-acetylmuramyl-(pentapeptide) pyrophosphoryl-undecaprenol N-acetylglucosamine transferase
MKKKIVVFTGGGTGGHVYPAQPLIKAFKEKGYRIVWIGSRKGIERKIVGDWDLEYKAISTGKLRRYFSLRNFTDLFCIAAGLAQSFILLLRLRPSLVFSKGGFVSVPPVAAAALLGIPSFTHDSDVVPGLATRINHRFTRRTFLAYQESGSYLKGEKVVVSGNPVRDDFFNEHAPLPAPWDARLNEKPLLMILGGSSGALQINRMIDQILERLTPDFTVIHQMGMELYGSLEDAKKHVSGYYPVPYLNEELPALLRRADLAVARAGAGTLWELAVSRTPSILIPLRSGSRGDQVDNARILSEGGMALVMDEAEPAAEDLMRLIRDLNADRERREEMEMNCRNFVKNRAEDVMMSYLTEVC